MVMPRFFLSHLVASAFGLRALLLPDSRADLRVEGDDPPGGAVRVLERSRSIRPEEIFGDRGRSGVCCPRALRGGSVQPAQGLWDDASPGEEETGSMRSRTFDRETGRGGPLLGEFLGIMQARETAPFARISFAGYRISA